MSLAEKQNNYSQTVFFLQNSPTYRQSVPAPRVFRVPDMLVSPNSMCSAYLTGGLASRADAVSAALSLCWQELQRSTFAQSSYNMFVTCDCWLVLEARLQKWSPRVILHLISCCSRSEQLDSPSAAAPRGAVLHKRVRSRKQAVAPKSLGQSPFYCTGLFLWQNTATKWDSRHGQ